MYDIRDIPDSERKKMDPEDFAGKGQSFPIQTPDDVHDAAQSIGRAGEDNHSADTLKANIKKIAKRKGPSFEARLPQAWKDEDTVDACDSVSMSMTDKGPRFAVRLGALVDGMTRIPIAILGRFKKGAQKFAITKQTMADIVRNFRARQAETPFDYEHASEFPEMAQGGPVPAAGWLKAIDDGPDSKGILWGTAEFTARAAAMIEAKEYKYLSPVIEYHAPDKTTGESLGAKLVSMALTNRPFLENMPAIAMSEWTKIDRGGADDEQKEKRTVVKKLVLADRAAGKVRVIAEDDTSTELILEGLEAQPKVIRLSDVKRGEGGRYDFGSLPQTGDTLIASDVVFGMTVQGELDEAVKVGKVTPAQRPHYEKLALSDLAGFRELVKTMPTQVQLREIGLGGSGDERNDFDRALAAVMEKVNAKRAANKDLDAGSAWRLVASEHPDLIGTYNQAAAKKERK